MRSVSLNFAVAAAAAFFPGNVRAEDIAIESFRLAPREPTPLTLSAYETTDAPLATLSLTGEERSGGTRQNYRFSTFKRDVSSAALEIGAITAVIAVPRIYRRAKGSDSFHFNSEGWFGRDTFSLGMDKMLHGWKAYVITDVVQSAIARRTGDRKSAAITAGIVGAGLMTLAEVGDGFSESTGFAKEDGIIHFVGAGVSVARNMVPGLRDKLDFRLSIKPKFDGTLGDGRGRLSQSKYLFALQLAGFKGMERSPFRFVELHAGYYARGFTDEERRRGDPLRRRVFVGLGFNVQALFARRPKSKVERWAKGAFDYIQVPYLMVH